MPHTDAWLPLFPLKTVLFPGGVLPLKVFETRYIDMVRECLRLEQPFGVVLIRSGQEVGEAAEPEAVGCLAYIRQCEMPSLGVLMLRAEGGERFRIRETRVQADNRLEARIEMIEADLEVPLDKPQAECAKALRIVIADVDANGAAAAGDGAPYDSPFARPLRFDNAGWVANRWCEVLPIPLKARQRLMELEDAQSRLSIVHQYLQQHKII